MMSVYNRENEKQQKKMKRMIIIDHSRNDITSYSTNLSSFSLPFFPDCVLNSPLEHSSFSDSWWTSYKSDLLKAHEIAQIDLKGRYLWMTAYIVFFSSVNQIHHIMATFFRLMLLYCEQRLQVRIICTICKYCALIYVRLPKQCPYIAVYCDEISF